MQSTPPLYRQSEIYARQGVELSRSVLSGWLDACRRLLSPLEEALRQYVLTDGKLHADDTPVPVLFPGNKKTKTGRLWTYVRDDRNAGSELPPAVWFATRLIERESIRKAILPISAASSRQMLTQDLMSYIAKTAPLSR